MGHTGAPAHPSSEGVRGLPGSTEHGGTGDTHLDTDVRSAPRALG